MIIHYVSKLEKSLKKSNKIEKVVDLHGFGSPASILRFNSVADIFSKDNIVKIHLPSADDFDAFESTIDFKNLLPAKVNNK